VGESVNSQDFAYAYNSLLLKRVPRRDRAIVGIALLILILLAWLYVGRLAPSVQVAGMDMTGTRMVSAGSRMVMTSSLQPWSGAEFFFRSQAVRPTVARLQARGLAVVDRAELGHSQRIRVDFRATRPGLQGNDDMDTTTLLIIIVVLLLLGGGWYGRGRWY
jgi:hypothetical protein